MTKVHLMRNKNAEIKVAAVCASRTVGGKVVRNSRQSYQDMSSKVVSFSEFKTVPAADRCAHCVAEGLLILNRQRREKGKTPVESLFL